MKRLKPYLSNYVNNLCFIFTCVCLAFAAYYLIVGAMYIELKDILRFIVISGAMALFQVLCFSDIVFKRLSYFARILIFFPLSLLTVLGGLLLMGFRISDFSRIFGKFMLIFIPLFLAMIVVFEIKYRLEGKKYDQILARKQSHEGNGSGVAD